MAVAGDVVIKLAADVAELKAGLTEATAKLDDFGAQAAKTGQQADDMAAGLGTVFKGLSIGAVIGVAIAEIKKLSAASEAAALDAEKMARQYNLTSEQVQALSRVSEQTGRSMDDLAKTGKANVAWLEQITAQAKAAGLVIDSEFTSKLRELDEQAADTDRKLKVLFAPATTAVKSWIADSMEAVKLNLQAIASNEGILDKLIALITLSQSGGGVSGARTNVMSSLERSIDTLKADVATLEGQLGAGTRLTPQQTEVYTNRLVEARQKLEAATHQRNLQLGQSVEGSPVVQPVPGAPVTVVGARGGGGRSDEDLMQAQIERYRALGGAAQRTYDAISQSHGVLVEDLQRELRVQQQIEDIAARLGAKYSEASDAQKAQLRDAITLNERLREVTAERLRQVAAAEELDARLGSGAAARQRSQRALERARAGGAEPVALTRAAKEQEEQLKANTLAAERYDDSLGSLAAGFELAALRYQRSNDLFSQGGQIFDALVSSMSEGLDALLGKSNKTFGEIAGSFARMLADMAMRAALSAAFKAVIGSIGGGLTGGYQGTVQFGGASGIDDLLGKIGYQGRAAGGPVEAGRPYMVGERGPETFVPASAGNIVPMGGGGSASSVTVNIDMGTTAGAENPSMALEFGRRVKSAVVDVIQSEKRPGGTLYARRSA